MNELAVNWKWAIQGYRGLPLSLSLSSSLSSPLHIVSPSCSSLPSPASPLACSFTFTRFYFPLSISPSSSISFLSSYLVAVRASFVTRAPASPSFFSLSPLSFLRQSLLPFLCARNVDLNDIFGGKFRGNRGKHSTLSGFFLRVPPTPSLFVQHRLSVLLRKQARPENIVDTYFARTSRPRGVVLATEPGGFCWLTLLHVY